MKAECLLFAAHYLPVVLYDIDSPRIEDFVRASVHCYSSPPYYSFRAVLFDSVSFNCNLIARRRVHTLSERIWLPLAIRSKSCSGFWLYSAV
jgi:hypothetical protein